jgi:glycosyltransferase involved in cell wall biosynthesis
MTIGLSMIVKDEPVDRLAMLIDYLKPIVTEFVIVDTGSRDIDLDEPLYNQWGVKVARFPWVDDFSAARNETLKYITSDWVLHLDADELPTRAMMEHIRENTPVEMMSQVLGWRYLTINFWGGEHGITVPEHWHVRLFRNRHGRWYKKIHEQVEIDGKQESHTVGNVIRDAPASDYLIHSKPREQIEKSALLYNRMER